MSKITWVNAPGWSQHLAECPESDLSILADASGLSYYFEAPTRSRYENVVLLQELGCRYIGYWNVDKIATSKFTIRNIACAYNTNGVRLRR